MDNNIQNTMDNSVSRKGVTPIIPTAKNWALWMFLTCIPLVNLILLIVWAVDKEPENIVRRNFARGYFIIMLIGIILAIIFASSLGVILSSLFN